MPPEIEVNVSGETPAEGDGLGVTPAVEVAAVSGAISEAANTQIAGALALAAIAEPDAELVGLVRELNGKVDGIYARLDSLSQTNAATAAVVVAAVEEAAEEVEEAAEETETAIEEIPEEVAESTEDAITEIPAIQERQKRRSFWL